jgi:hypothetical protein
MRILHSKIETGSGLLASDIQNLTFFPKGTILMYDGQLWDRTGGIPGWHICDGKDGTINLTDKFIRGGTAARQTGGQDIANVPSHNHTFSGTNETGEISSDGRANGGVWSHPIVNLATGVFSLSGDRSGAPCNDDHGGVCAGVKFSMTPKGTISTAGTVNADNRPAFCTVIFIEKMTNYLE